MSVYENVFFPLRQRTGFSACDTGILLWRANFLTLSISFAIPLTILVVIGALIPEKIYLKVFIAAIWWLKPLFDRLAVHIIQIRFFNKDARGKILFKGLFKTLTTALLGDLFWRRFSIKRSVIMPIRILELLEGKRLALRKVSLQRGGIDFGIFLSVFCLSLEVLFFSSTLFFYYIFTQMFNSSQMIFSFDNSWFWICIISYLINYIIVETMYVCCGFAIYINSRVIVEGWDLQLAFKGLQR